MLRLLSLSPFFTHSLSCRSSILCECLPFSRTKTLWLFSLIPHCVSSSTERLECFMSISTSHKNQSFPFSFYDFIITFIAFKVASTEAQYFMFCASFSSCSCATKTMRTFMLQESEKIMQILTLLHVLLARWNPEAMWLHHKQSNWTVLNGKFLFSHFICLLCYCCCYDRGYFQSDTKTKARNICRLLKNYDTNLL